jgi:hypothetical protein
MSTIRIAAACGVLLVCASVHAAPNSNVTVVNTPAQAVPVTVTQPVVVTATQPVPVAVTNARWQATIYNEVLFFQVPNPSPQGTTVPPGKRRIITSVAAEWWCPVGHTTYLVVTANAPLFLSAPKAFSDGTLDYFTSTLNLDYPVGAGQHIEVNARISDSNCAGNVFLSGYEVVLPQP